MNNSLELKMKLPQSCALIHIATGGPVVIHRGESGFYQMPDDFNVGEYNISKGATIPQVKAMEAGSMFGWDCPAADPANWDEDGVMVP